MVHVADLSAQPLRMLERIEEGGEGDGREGGGEGVGGEREKEAGRGERLIARDPKPPPYITGLRFPAWPDPLP